MPIYRPVIGINATVLLSPRTGIGQYVYHLSNELIGAGLVEPRFFYPTGWSNTLRRSSVANIQAIKKNIKRYLPSPYATLRKVVQAQFSLGLLRRKVDLYHEPNYLSYNFRGPTVLTVHDISWVRHPETHPIERIRAMERYFSRSLETAAAILTDSAHVKQELIDVFGVDPEKITSVLLGVTEDFHPRGPDETFGVLSKNGLTHGQYLLSVGTLEPRKNISSVIDAYSKLPQEIKQQFPLAMVGMKGWLTSGIEKKMLPLVQSGLIKPLGYLEDADMPAVYAGAAAFLFPSIYEGFGLPVLEAMASGTPVLSSNRSSLPEVVGNAGILIDPLDVGAISESIVSLLRNQQLREKFSQLGVDRAADFTWSKTAKETTKVYQDVLALL